jgi:hypothetical protein
MKTDWLDWAIEYLERDEDIVVPVKRLWNAWRARQAEPDLETFTAGILADGRVEAMGEVDHTEDMEDLPPEERAEYERDMESMGYYSGPRVKLRARELTLEHIVKMIARHNDRMETALRQAREAMDDDVDEQTEGMLIDIQAKAAEFRRHLREAGLEAQADEDVPGEAG